MIPNNGTNLIYRIYVSLGKPLQSKDLIQDIQKQHSYNWFELIDHNMVKTLSENIFYFIYDLMEIVLIYGSSDLQESNFLLSIFINQTCYSRFWAVKQITS